METNKTGIRSVVNVVKGPISLTFLPPKDLQNSLLYKTFKKIDEFSAKTSDSLTAK